jgi:hypothetical protein
MVHFTIALEIPKAFILSMSSTHIYYNASFLRRNIAQWNTISPPECNLSIPPKTTQKFISLILI